MTLTSVASCLQQLEQQYQILDTLYCDQYTSQVDFYLRIKKLHRDSFENNHRIVFIVTQDYHKNNKPGSVLQNIQKIVNDIDISNFFITIVTTNKNIYDDYEWVQKNISIDPDPFELCLCQGSYIFLEDAPMDDFTKYATINNAVTTITQLTESQRELLFENKFFCILPWTALNIEPNSQVKICCESTQTIGDCSQDSLEQIWNSSSIKKIRQDMLAGQRVESCSGCYRKENLGRDTLRKSSNRSLLHRAKKIDSTCPDGQLDDFSLNYIDIRYSNLCNLSCRSCGPDASSSWYAPAMAIGRNFSQTAPMLIAGKNKQDIYQQVIEHANHIDKIYFAGGEPLIMDECYDILELLDKQNQHGVQLIYNTNLTKLKLKNRNIIDLWKKFPKVSVGASLDGEEERGEYIRSGTQWKTVVKNRQIILQECPHVDFYISATVSLLNVLHLPDFHRSWVEQGLINPENFNIQLLFSPAYLKFDVAPVEIKNQIQKKYQAHLDWLIPKDKLGRATYGFTSVLNSLDSEVKFNATDFWFQIDQLDNFYQQDFLSTFPELSSLPRE